MKFTGKNFQPWPEFELDLKGLTVVSGPSDKGKSSLFRALKGVVRNEIPAEFVRWHQSENLELTLTLENGTTITASRSVNGSTKYTVDPHDGSKPKEYTSLNKKIPQEIKDLNFGIVEIGDVKLDPIFAPQFGQQFILQNAGPSDLNTILGAFASTEKLEAGKKQANLFITQKNAEAKTLAREIVEAEARCHELREISDSGNNVRDQIHRLEPLIRALEAAGFWLGRATHSQRRLIPLRDIVASLTLPDTAEAEKLEQQVKYLTQAHHSKTRVSFLRQVSDVLEPLTTSWNTMVAVSRKIKALNEAVIRAQRVEEICNLDVARQLNDVIGKLEAGRDEAVRLQGSIKYMEQAALLRQRVADLKAAQAEAENNLAGKTQELHNEQVRQNVCPKCGKPLEHICG